MESELKYALLITASVFVVLIGFGVVAIATA
ncbi:MULTISPECIES: cytochrome bd-I oxidase subunit CydH [Vibrio]|nr:MULTISPECIES: YnhF family membrane protein [Vibrio]MDA0147939.1 YnhF family membrane protein [Vibrio sp. LaRot3]